MEENLYKRRSVAACISNAFSLHTDNIWKIIRGLLPYALISALLMAVSNTAMLNILSGNNTSTVLAIIMYASYFLFIISIIFFTSKAFYIFDLLPMKRTTKRLFIFYGILFLFLILCSLIIFGIFYYGTPFLMKIVTTPQGLMTMLYSIGGVLGIIVILILLPTLYVLMNYIYGNSTIKDFGKDYKTGIKYYFFILGIFLLCMLIVATLSFVVTLPIFILSKASLSASESMSLGDPNNLPGNFTLLAFIATFLSALITMIVASWELLVVRYMYGSIEARKNQPIDQTSNR